MMLSAKELNKGKGMENGNIAIYLDILPLHNLLVQQTGAYSILIHTIRNQGIIFINLKKGFSNKKS